MNRADAQGNGQALGRDPYFDDLFCNMVAAGEAGGRGEASRSSISWGVITSLSRR